ncbi:MAG: flagellar basal body rod protein FlgB [Phycisphaerales bacterium]|nr:flagellar basal body rod protein FlgB [Phycisphaerales bacterium]
MAPGSRYDNRTLHVMINGLDNSGSLPVMQRVVQFAARRHSVIADNVANISTPGFRPVDVSLEDFEAALGEAVQSRRASGQGRFGALEVESTPTVQFDEGGIRLQPEPIGENILFQDGNDRSLERLMQDLVENFLTYRTAVELMNNQFDMLDVAIRERI